jgi:glycosyltransferase involved in cell wall biosynthesis
MPPLTQTPSGDPVHIAQISYDDSVFEKHAACDTYQRWQSYARKLHRQRPHSLMTAFIFTHKHDARTITDPMVRFVPIHGVGLRKWCCLRRELLRAHHHLPIDVVTTQTIAEDAWLALAFARGRATRVVGQIHYDLFSPVARRLVFGRGLRGRLRYYASLRFLRYLDGLRVVSRATQRRLKQRGVAVPISVIPVPITIAVEPCAEANVGDDERYASPPKVLFVGRLVAEKNLSNWLKVAHGVCQIMPEVIFEIIGDGPQRRSLEQLRDSLGLADHVTFRGAIPHNELSQFYQSAHVFLFASHCEGFGRVVAEASWHALPVVVPGIAGVEDIVDDGITGFVHEPHDLKAMAQSVVTLLMDRNLCQRMGVAGRELVRSRFNPDLLTEQWINCLLSTSSADSQTRIAS